MDEDKILEAFWCKLEKTPIPHAVSSNYIVLDHLYTEDIGVEKSSKLISKQEKNILGFRINRKFRIPCEIVFINIKNERTYHNFHVIVKDDEKVAEIKQRIENFYNKYRENSLNELLCR